MHIFMYATIYLYTYIHIIHMYINIQTHIRPIYLYTHVHLYRYVDVYRTGRLQGTLHVRRARNGRGLVRIRVVTVIPD